MMCSTPARWQSQRAMWLARFRKDCHRAMLMAWRCRYGCKAGGSADIYLFMRGNEEALRPPRHCGQARVPVNGKLPIGPMPISPLMLSPETLPMNSSVNGIGLVIDTFQLTASPLMAPSKISVELPSAPCVPVSVPPEANRVSVAL